LDAVTAGQPVDPARFYVTGISLGGYGTWFLLATMPERIAAAVPVCGGGDPARAAVFKEVPLWVFHGARDPAVPPAASRRMVEALRQAGGQPKFTEYPDLQHDSWTRTYRNPEVLAWLFAQRRGGRAR
jgi:predicted peptidase